MPEREEDVAPIAQRETDPPPSRLAQQALGRARSFQISAQSGDLILEIAIREP